MSGAIGHGCQTPDAIACARFVVVEQHTGFGRIVCDNRGEAVERIVGIAGHLPLVVGTTDDVASTVITKVCVSRVRADDAVDFTQRIAIGLCAIGGWIASTTYCTKRRWGIAPLVRSHFRCRRRFRASADDPERTLEDICWSTA